MRHRFFSLSLLIILNHSRDLKFEAKKDELSEKISDFSSKTESLLGPADVGPLGLSRLLGKCVKGTDLLIGR